MQSMKKIILLSFHIGILLSVIASNEKAFSQGYKTVELRGFNSDIVVNGETKDPQSTITSTPYFGADNVGGVFMADDFNYMGYKPAYFFPADRIVNSTFFPGLVYKLAPYNANNSLTLHNSQGTLEFVTPIAADTFYVLATSGSGESYITYSVRFTDDSTMSGVAFNDTIPDWYVPTHNQSFESVIGSRFVIKQDNVKNLFQVRYTAPGLYCYLYPVGSPKKIKSLTATAQGDGYCNILAVSIKPL